MTKTTKENEPHPRKEGNDYSNNKASSSSSTPWLRLKDPRIVRVSRACGGKDRHSKVCTVRGLRDRRVRLSVPTAIQLYHLQDRLGLSQPSKVVEWLLNAAKHEIEKLPPLPILPSAPNFSLLIPGHDASSIATLYSDDHVKNDNELGNNNDNNSSLGWSNFWTNNCSDLWREKSKEVVLRETTKSDVNKENSSSTRKLEGSDGIVIGNNRNNNMFHTNNHQRSCFPGNLPINGYYPLLMSHLGGGIGFSHGLTELNNNINLQSLNNLVSLQPSPLSLSTGSQFLTSATTTTSTSIASTSTSQTLASNSFQNGLEIHDPTIPGRQANHFQSLSSNVSAQSLVPNPIMRSLFHFGMSNTSSTYDNSGNNTAQQRSKMSDH